MRPAATPTARQTWWRSLAAWPRFARTTGRTSCRRYSTPARWRSCRGTSSADGFGRQDAVLSGRRPATSSQPGRDSLCVRRTCGKKGSTVLAEDDRASLGEPSSSDSVQAEPGRKWLSKLLLRLGLSLAIAAFFVWLLRAGALPIVPTEQALAVVQWWTLPVYAVV